MSDHWVGQLSASMRAAYVSEVPRKVLERAGVQILDALACAAGAFDAPPVAAARRAVRGSGPVDATVLFSGERASLVDAVLVNGAAVRYLDFNDAFIGSGPGGHPSDNIAVALAVGEREQASGRDVLAAIVLGYELFWRLRQHVYAKTEKAASWDGTSVSGVVSALIAGLLLELDEERLGNALAIGAAKGYGLKQVRRGSISTMKACGNALVAREGTLAALLAAEGITGPGEVFEGSSGLINAFGLEASEELKDALVAPPEWAIEGISIKLYPAIATSQAAIHGAVTIASEQRLSSEEIESVTIRLPDSKATREHLGIEQRMRPDSRETADHSMPFLIACALEDAIVSHAQFEGERWYRPATLQVMERIQIRPDAELTKRAQRCYPAVVEVTTVSGQAFRAEVVPTPGSPELPWGIEDVTAKFTRSQQLGLDGGAIDAIAGAVRLLPEADDLQQFVESVRGRP